jgi:hypothetical protein
MNMNSSPTIEDFRALMRQCNDETHHHIVWIGRDGEVHVDPMPHELGPIGFERAKPEMMVRFATLSMGAGYVGPEAAADEAWSRDAYEAVCRHWKTAQLTSGIHYAMEW